MVQSVTQPGDTVRRGLGRRSGSSRPPQFLDQPVHLPPGEPGDAPHIGVRERLPGALGSPPDHTFDSRPRRLPLAGRHGASAPRRRQPRQGSEFERPPGLVVPAPFQIAVVMLHDDDASGPFRHLDIFDDRRQLGIRAVAHRPLQPIQVHLGRHSAYGPSASQDSFGHAEHHRAAPAVRHADRPLDRRTETPLPVPAPLFESQILILQVVHHAMVESLEEFLDLRNRSQNSLPSPRPVDREPTARIVGGASHRAGQGEAKFGTPHRSVANAPGRRVASENLSEPCSRPMPVGGEILSGGPHRQHRGIGTRRPNSGEGQQSSNHVNSTLILFTTTSTTDLH